VRRLLEIAADEKSMATIVMLTNAFEGLASMRIAQIKGQVLQAQQFFAEAWQIYYQLRVDELFRYGRQDFEEVSERELFIAITAEGGFSGDIDQRLIRTMMKDYDPKKHDIIIIGHHGALQLIQAGVKYQKYYKLPANDQHINIHPLVQDVRRYKAAYVYYQSYVSLMTQEIKRIELAKAVQQMGKAAGDSKEAISEKNYIFEPSPFAVVAHLEQSMVDITLSQVILESKLAQYASRFRAMRVANERSTDSLHSLHTQFNHAKRSQSDERLKEIINGLKKTRAVA
jgi:ATP synthase F1 gamma subunit